MKSFLFVGLPAALALAALAGCSSLDVLSEPDPIPVTVNTYAAMEFGNATRGVAVGLDLSDCVEHAMLISKRPFGGSSVDAQFPVQDVVRREFAKCIDQNFHATRPGEMDDVRLKVTTMRILLTDRFTKVTSDVSLNIKVIHPDGTRAPLFRKTYRSQTYGPMDDDDEVPTCFYRSVQEIVSEFVTDISANPNLVEYFKGKSKEKTK